MTTPLYRAILKQAWQIAARHKALWLFGFLATFFGLGGEWQFLFNQYFNFSDGGYAELVGLVNLTEPEIWQLLSATFSALPGRAFALLLALLALALAFLWIIITAQGGLVLAIASAAAGANVSIKQSFVQGSRSFWSLLGIMISTRLLGIFIIAVVGLPLLALVFAVNEAFISLGSTLLFFVLYLPVIIIFSLIGKLAVNACLIENYNWRDSLVRALRLFAGHWLVCLELAFILLIIAVLAAVLFVPVAALLVLPLVFFGFVLAKFSLAILHIFLLAAAVLFFLLLLFLSSWLGAFTNAVWTVLFLKIKAAPAQSKLARILHNWREKYT